MSTISNQTSRKTLPLRERKSLLRKQIQSVLDKLTDDELNQQSHSATQKVIKTPHFQNAKSLCLYLSMPKAELRTDELIRHCFKQKKRVFVPRITPESIPHSQVNNQTDSSKVYSKPKRILHFLEIFDESDLFSCPRNNWEIPEPPEKYNNMTRPEATDCEELSLMILPGVAFDRSNHRLGHGMGFYDKYTAQMRKRRNELDLGEIHLMGIGLKQQFVDELPVGQHDIKMDLVVIAD